LTRGPGCHYSAQPEFDRRTQAFLARVPAAVVVHIGCGLDTRFERVDNGQVEWYGLDLPEVIELRRQLIGGKRSATIS
jgi:O-methyltransferase involved in polyketide biosynthesis